MCMKFDAHSSSFPSYNGQSVIFIHIFLLLYINYILLTKKLTGIKNYQPSMSSENQFLPNKNLINALGFLFLWITKLIFVDNLKT